MVSFSPYGLLQKMAQAVTQLLCKKNHVDPRRKIDFDASYDKNDSNENNLRVNPRRMYDLASSDDENDSRKGNN